MNPEHVKVTPMTADHAMREWEVLSSLMAKVIDHACGRYTLEDTKERVRTGMALPLAIWNSETKHIYAVMICEAEVYPLKKVFAISMCGGAELEDWGHIWPQIKDLARGMGYDQIEIVGRPGWKRFITGAKEIARVWIEELGDGDDSHH